MQAAPLGPKDCRRENIYKKSFGKMCGAKLTPGLYARWKQADKGTKMRLNVGMGLRRQVEHAKVTVGIGDDWRF